MTDNDVIAHIEAIRSRNNRLWMDLVRLAFRVAPEEARAIARDIEECDRQIARWTAELAGLPCG